MVIKGKGKPKGKREKRAPAKGETLLERLQNRFGPEIVMYGNSPPRNLSDGDVISTGSIGLDSALGVGGLPLGRVVEIFGPEASGKTTLCLHVVANALRAGMPCAYIDAEHALDFDYAEHLGVKRSKLLVSQPDYGEQALEVALAMVSEGVKVVVVDSVAALVPKAELEGEMGDSHVGLQARMMSQAMRKIAGKAQVAGSMILFVNQIRMKIGVMFGSPETTTGGGALKFYSSVRLDIRRIGMLKKAGEPYGSRTRVKVVKNKLAPPFREVELDIVWGEGFSRGPQIVDMATELGVIEKSGSWFSYGGDRIGQGRDSAIALLDEDTELADVIEAEVRSALRIR